jgi:hypothetical protein
MSATTIAGSTPPAYIDRAAQAYEDKTAWRNVAQVTSITTILAVMASFYFAHLPREVPVLVPVTADGAYMTPIRTTTPDEAGKEKMLHDWIGDCRVGGDPQSLPMRQCRQLIPSTPQGTAVAQVVAEHNQLVASQGMRVSVTIRSFTPSAAGYEIGWDESLTAAGSGVTTTHAMIAFVSIGFAQQNGLLHGDPWMNPFGMYVTSLRIIDEGDTKK